MGFIHLFSVSRFTLQNRFHARPALCRSLSWFTLWNLVCEYQFPSLLVHPNEPLLWLPCTLSVSWFTLQNLFYDHPAYCQSLSWFTLQNLFHDCPALCQSLGSPCRTSSMITLHIVSHYLGSPCRTSFMIALHFVSLLVHPAEPLPWLLCTLSVS